MFYPQIEREILFAQFSNQVKRYVDKYRLNFETTGGSCLFSSKLSKTKGEIRINTKGYGDFEFERINKAVIKINTENPDLLPREGDSEAVKEEKNKKYNEKYQAEMSILSHSYDKPQMVSLPGISTPQKCYVELEEEIIFTFNFLHGRYSASCNFTSSVGTEDDSHSETKKTVSGLLTSLQNYFIFASFFQENDWVNIVLANDLMTKFKALEDKNLVELFDYIKMGGYQQKLRVALGGDTSGDSILIRNYMFDDDGDNGDCIRFWRVIDETNYEVDLIKVAYNKYRVVLKVNNETISDGKDIIQSVEALQDVLTRYQDKSRGLEEFIDNFLGE